MELILSMAVLSVSQQPDEEAVGALARTLYKHNWHINLCLGAWTLYYGDF